MNKWGMHGNVLIGSQVNWGFLGNSFILKYYNHIIFGKINLSEILSVGST